MASVHQDIYLTVHGPLITEDERLPENNVSVDWVGALPTKGIEALRALVQAANFPAFRAALSQWKAPTLNFAYADDQGSGPASAL